MKASQPIIVSLSLQAITAFLYSNYEGRALSSSSCKIKRKITSHSEVSFWWSFSLLMFWHKNMNLFREHTIEIEVLEKVVEHAVVERFPRGCSVARRGRGRGLGEQLVVHEHGLHAGAQALEQQLGARPHATLCAFARSLRRCRAELSLPLLLSAPRFRVLLPPVSCAAYTQFCCIISCILHRVCGKKIFAGIDSTHDRLICSLSAYCQLHCVQSLFPHSHKQCTNSKRCLLRAKTVPPLAPRGTGGSSGWGWSGSPTGSDVCGEGLWFAMCCAPRERPLRILRSGLRANGLRSGRASSWKVPSAPAAAAGDDCNEIKSGVAVAKALAVLAERGSVEVSAAAGAASGAAALVWRRLRSRTASDSVPSGAPLIRRSSATRSTNERAVVVGGDMSVPTERLPEPISVLEGCVKRCLQLWKSIRRVERWQMFARD